MSEEELMELCTESVNSNTKEHKNAWKKIAECLPNRSVYSLQKVARRKFNPNNYNGKWTKAQEDHFIALVEKHNRKWRIIGEELGRTAENCRDKFRELGGLNHLSRKQHKWDLAEKYQLIMLIQKYTGLDLIKRQVVFEYDHFKDVKDGNTLSEKERKHFNRGYKVTERKMHLYKEFDLKDIMEHFIHKDISEEKIRECKMPWAEITKNIEGRAYHDCRNEWNTKIVNLILENTANDRRADKKLLNFIIEGDFDEDDEINFKEINNSRSAKKNQERWQILQKSVMVKNKRKAKTSAIAQIIKDEIKNSKRNLPENLKPKVQIDILSYYRNMNKGE